MTNQVTIKFIGIGPDGEALYVTNILPVLFKADRVIVEANKRDTK